MLTMVYFIEILINFRFVWMLDIYCGFSDNNKCNHMCIWMNYWKRKSRYFSSIIQIFDWLNNFILFYMIYLWMNEWMTVISIFMYINSSNWTCCSYLIYLKFLHTTITLKTVCSLQNIWSCWTIINKWCVESSWNLLYDTWLTLIMK